MATLRSIPKGHPPDSSAMNLSPFKGGLFLFILILSTLSYQPVAAQQITTFILVRHAEKADNGTNDPPLNEIGKQRAATLADHFKEADITAIYATPYKRTRQTVELVAHQKGLKINEYQPSDADFLTTVLEKNQGGLILIVGHSNTIPSLVNELIGKKRYQDLDETDYDNLYIISVATIGQGKNVHLTY